MAIRAPDPHNLRTAAGKTGGAIIEIDRPCVGCGYNLRGLRLGINCPECGMPSIAPADVDDPLSLMPRRIIFAFIRGCWMASLCAGLLLALVTFARIEWWPPRIFHWLFAGLAVLWLLATGMLTPAFPIPQAIYYGFSHASRLRRAARWLQWGWLLAAGSRLAHAELLAAGIGSSWFPLLRFGFGTGKIIGLAGIVVLAILLEKLADWTRDDDAARFFNWSMWGLPVSTLLLDVQAPLPFVSLLLLLVWLVMICIFPLGLVSLSKSVTLSVLHSVEHVDRQQRREQRNQRFHDKLGQRAAQTDPRGGRGK